MNEIRPGKNGLRRIAAFSSGGLAIAAAALMLLAPMSAGATVIIPVKKLGASVGYGVQTGACAKAKLLAAPKWTPSSGLFHTAGMVTAPKCGPSFSYNSAFLNSEVNLNTVIHFKANGNYTITVAWTITEASVWNATPWSSCTLNYKVAYSTCLASASSEIFGYAYLYDQNNGSYFNFGTYIQSFNYTSTQNYSENYCYAGTCYHYGGNSTYGGPSGSFSGTVMQNSTVSATGTKWVNSKDSYSLYVTLYVFLDASAYTQNAKATGTGSAIASMNLATLGNGAHLTSVSYA